MNHAFDTDMARKVGLDEAIMLNCIEFWVNTNEGNATNFRNGRHWMYNSAVAFAKVFPYWTPKQIRRILASLIDQGLVITDQLGGTDRSTWYALSDSFFAIFPNRQMDKSAGERPLAQTGKSHTGTNTVPNTEGSVNDAADIYALYPRKVGRPNALKSIDKAIKKVGKPHLLTATHLFAKSWAGASAEDLAFCPHPATWFNQERYNDDPETWKPRSHGTHKQHRGSNNRTDNTLNSKVAGQYAGVGEVGEV